VKIRALQLAGPATLLCFCGDHGVATHRAQTPGHRIALAPSPQGRRQAKLYLFLHAVPTLDISSDVIDFLWKSKPNQMKLGED
jgi:hypothetical protein